MSSSIPAAQRGAVPLLPLIVVAILIAGGVLWWLKSGDPDSVGEAGPAVMEQAEPEPIAAVNLDQRDKIESAPAIAARAADPQAQGADKQRLFNEGQKVRPFVDGYTSEAEAAAAASPTKPETAAENFRLINAFDYGVLDGRVRIGVFGNGPIPRYRTRRDGDDFIIEMPGQFRFSRPLDHDLTIEAFRVAGARLQHRASGLTLTISTASPLQHVPFVVEDTYGLMMAFEPRRPGIGQ